MKLTNIKLNDVCIKITDGVHNTVIDDADSACFLLSCKNIKNNSIVINDNDRRISRETLINLRKRTQMSQGDVVLSSVGTIGEAAIIKDENPNYEFQRSVAIFKPNFEKIISKFLYYSLIYNKAAFQFLAEGAVQQCLFIAPLKNFPISLPPLDVQKRIAGILGALDDRIDVLRRENVVLEQMAQAVFQSWFVDFDIVRAKAAGTPESEVCEKYHITPELYALFPSALTPDNLPLGWEKKSLPEIATYLNGLPLQKFPPKNEDEFLPVIKIAELKARSVVGADKASTDIDSKYIIDDGDVIFSWSGSLAVDIWCCGKGALNQHLFKVFSSDYPKWFYYLWTRKYLFQFQQIAAGKATTMGHIQRSHLEEAKANVPSEKILTAADKIISPLIEKIIDNRKQIRTLEQTRDALLPQLLSGKIKNLR